MDKDSDDRLIQNGTLRHAENVEITNSEGSDEGTVQNPYSNKQLTSLDLGLNLELGLHPNTLGKYEDEARNKIYWFVKSNTGCYLLEWDNTSQSVSYVLKDTRAAGSRVLELNDLKLITGVSKVTNDNIEDDLLIWTDDNMEICCINIERA